MIPALHTYRWAGGHVTTACASVGPPRALPTHRRTGGLKAPRSVADDATSYWEPSEDPAHLFAPTPATRRPLPGFAPVGLSSNPIPHFPGFREAAPPPAPKRRPPHHRGVAPSCQGPSTPFMLSHSSIIGILWDVTGSMRRVFFANANALLCPCFRPTDHSRPDRRCAPQDPSVAAADASATEAETALLEELSDSLADLGLPCPQDVAPSGRLLLPVLANSKDCAVETIRKSREKKSRMQNVSALEKL